MRLFRRRNRAAQRVLLEKRLPGFQERAAMTPHGPRRKRKYRNSQADDCWSELACGAFELCLPSLVLVLWALPQLATVLVVGHTEGRAVGAVRVYQRRVSARRPACCRYTPTCSAYAVQALQRHGTRAGTVLAARRLLRCRPGGGRGIDPVPR